MGSRTMSPSQSCEMPQYEWISESASLFYDTQSKRPFPSTRPPPTSNQALQALRVVINYAKPKLEDSSGLRLTYVVGAD